jgi:Fe-S-cluster-containing dehydrogenase component/anaerobic selenocysteine-containing dehydrogenase
VTAELRKGHGNIVMTDSQLDRRRFLALAGASAALAKTAGCTRQPPEQIVPYVRQPEQYVSGPSQHYATSMVHAGVATGLLVRSQTGRPIKVEGNPDHPASLGATDAFAQASLLSLYDPERSQVLTRLGRITTWERFAAEIGQAVSERRAAGGAGLRILTEMVTSPSLAAEIGALLAESPAARWCRFEPCGAHHTGRGLALAFGRPLSVRYEIAAADVVVAIDSDFAANEPGSLRYARDLARRRAPDGTGALGHTSAVRGALPPSPSMNRLYSIESSPTCTGTLADHHLALRPSEVGLFAAALAAELGAAPRDASLGELPPRIARWAAVVAADLRAAGPRGLVIAGEPAIPAVHALVAAMNDSLDSVGTTVFYSEPIEASPVDHLASIGELCDDMRAGRVSLLVVLGGNPALTAPAELDFAGAMQSAGLRVHLALHADETSALCHYHVPEAHWLESWGDARAFDGTVSLIQPLIEPLYQGRTALELVHAMRGLRGTSLDLVRDQFRRSFGEDRTDAAWNRALSDGVVAGTAPPATRPFLAPDVAQRALLDVAAAARQKDGYELSIRPDPTVFDGRFSHNAWLQELPKPLTTLVWENAALVGPRTAEELQVESGDVVVLAIDGRSVRAPVLVLGRQSEGTVTVTLGYGRRSGGPVAEGLGFDAYRLRRSGALWHAPGLRIGKTGERVALATTQQHFDPHHRPHARAATASDFMAHPEIIRDMAEEPPEPLTMYPEWKHEGRAWGMTIDQSACTGCSACVVACQAENNIPVVGKAQVLAGHEMHWLRIDRYEVPLGSERVTVHQPMMCVHCEHAPCEYVCPVAATTHSAEGVNEMTYNRCVGTRYCANNCPYKVRRFNYLEYQEPRSRHRTLKLLGNPDVTIRSRGVMEKCTYCIQRIAAGRIEAERSLRAVQDGEVVTACQQACPTGAITFGDIHDPASRVRLLKANPRAYGVLAELNTRPRTSHLARILNPNPELPYHG